MRVKRVLACLLGIGGFFLLLDLPNVWADATAAEVLVAQGNALYRSGDYAGAVTKYDAAIVQDASYAIAHSNRGLALAKLMQYSDAKAALQQAIALDASEKRFLLNLGKVYAENDETTSAIEQFDQALVLDPAYAPAYANRAWCHEELAHYTEAAQDYTSALTNDVQCYDALCGMGIVQARLGNTEDAVWWLMRAIAASSAYLEHTSTNVLAHRNLRILRGNDFELESSVSETSFMQGVNQLEREQYANAVVTFTELAASEAGAAVIQDFLAHALFLHNPADPQYLSAYTTLQALLPSITVSSIPSVASAFVDYQYFGLTPANVWLFPGLYTYTLKSGNFIGQAEMTVTASSTWELGFPENAQIDLDAVISQEGKPDSFPNALVPGADQRIYIRDIMLMFALHGFSVLPNEQLARHNLWFTAVNGFFQGSENACTLTAACASSHVVITKNEADFSEGNQWIEFSTGTFSGAVPPPTIFTFTWTSERTSGSMSLALYHDQDGDGLVDYLETQAGSNLFENDSDDDSMDDLWEYENGLNPVNAKDPDLDPDEDLLPNYGEWAIGTDPQDPQSPTTVFVDDGTGDDDTGDGFELLPWKTVQYAIDSVSGPGIVRIGPGTYKEVIKLKDHLALIGAGAWGVNATILQPPDGVQSTVLFIPDTYYPGPLMAVVGCVHITGGYTTGYGGGIYLNCGRPARFYLFSTELSHNTAYEGGGAKLTDYGGLGYDNCVARISGCIIRNNASTWVVSAGGLHFHQIIPTIINSLICDNTNGGAYFLGAANPKIISSTFVGNTHDELNFDTYSGLPEIRSSIVWGSIGLRAGKSVALSYSCVYDTDLTGDSIIYDNPSFAKSSVGDYRLRPNSPCIDAADGDVSASTDISGRERWDDPNVINTGKGSPDFADMGAYEFERDTPVPDVIGMLLTEAQNAILNAGLYVGIITEDNCALGFPDQTVIEQDPVGLTGGGCSVNLTISVPNTQAPIVVLRGLSELFHEQNRPYNDPGVFAQDDCEGDISTNIITTGLPIDTSVPGTYTISYDVCDLFLNCAQTISRTVRVLPVFFVNAASAAKTNNGNSWETAFANIQEAVNAASPTGGIIWVAEGTYHSASDPVLTMAPGVAIYGGFCGREICREERNWTACPTIIDGENARRCAVGANDSILDGFVLRYGKSNYGGAMANNSVSPSISNCIFENSVATASGGGVYNGAGASPVFKNCIFRNNSCTSYGGGAQHYQASAQYVNSLFYSNSAYGGGGVNVETSTCNMMNCTLYGNSPNGNSSARSTIVYCNSIFWMNTPSEIVTFSDSVTVQYCNVRNGYSGTGNLNTDPLFINAGGGDFRLACTSPCRDTGTATGASDMDLRSFLRPQGTGVDRGAYEMSPDTENPPEVIAINCLDESPAAAVSVRFLVVFSEDVSGVEAGDFSLAVAGSITGASVTGVSGDGQVFIVIVNTGQGAGTLRLDVLESNDIRNICDESLVGGFFNGEVYTINEIEGQEEGAVEGQTEGQAEGLIEGEGQIEGQAEGLIEGEGQEEGAVEGLLEGEGQTEGEGEVEGSPLEGEIHAFKIVQQPRSASLYVGMSWTASILVEGGEGTIVYVWEKDGIPLGWPNVMVYTLGPLTEGDAGVYRCTVSDGITTLVSEEAELSVYPVPPSGQHDVDQNKNWVISLSELLRVVQFFNSAGFHCDAGSEDGYAPGAGDQTCGAYDADYAPQDWSITLSELLRIIQFFNSGCYHIEAGTEDGYAPGAGK
ncbi:MAG TPA: tetratricopeptide repeat protein [Candidatus Hydrogenedentes bacterium]|nr:tetratricopeptide repeat protein [Candidatus Hydrogenedentota bacterium]